MDEIDDIEGKRKQLGWLWSSEGPTELSQLACACLRLLVYQAALLHTHTCTHALMRMKGIQNKNYSLILSLDLIVSCFHACFLSFNSLSYVTRFCLCLRSQCIFHLRTHSRRTIESKSFRVRERKEIRKKERATTYFKCS
jgi:hypothetical protein